MEQQPETKQKELSVSSKWITMPYLFLVSTTRSATVNQRSKFFQTVIDPDQDKIEICQQFKSAWINELQQHPWGMLLHPNGKTVMLELEIDHGNSYMTNGKNVALLFGFRQPTQVKLKYGIEDNAFTLSLINEDAVINLTSDDENEDVYMSDTGNYTLWEHQNDRVFGWEVDVSEAYANETKEQVLHIPAKTAKFVLRGQKTIFTRSLHNLDNIKCTLKTYRRKVGNKIKVEMFLTRGWYDFHKANDLQVGDKLKCQLSDPPEVLVIEIVRRNALNQNA